MRSSIGPTGDLRRQEHKNGNILEHFAHFCVGRLLFLQQYKVIICTSRQGFSRNKKRGAKKQYVTAWEYSSVRVHTSRYYVINMWLVTSPRPTAEPGVQ